MLAFFVLAGLSSVWFSPTLTSIDWPVIVVLFSLITTINYWQYFGLFERIIVKLSNQFSSAKTLQTSLVAFAFLSSMLITNDVTIIILLALFLPLSKRIDINPTLATVLIVVAANLGSALTPLGNPQNMFLYFYSKLSLGEFLYITAPITMLSAVLLLLLCRWLPDKALDYQLDCQQCFSSRGSLLFSAVFVSILLGLFHWVPLYIVFLATMLAATVSGIKQIRQQNYSLLLTFVFAFIFIANISQWPQLIAYVTHSVGTPIRLFLSTILTSQIISNVPAAILLAHFTQHWQPLIIGVNLGGLGTLIASMASLIGYKAFSAQYPHLRKAFLYQFSLANIGLLALLASPYVVYYLLT